MHLFYESSMTFHDLITQDRPQGHRHPIGWNRHHRNKSRHVYKIPEKEDIREFVCKLIGRIDRILVSIDLDYVYFNIDIIISWTWKC